MPELPEVQTIVSDLRKKIVGLSIKKVWIDVPKLIKKPSLKEFEKNIRGLKINSVERRGKNILINLVSIKNQEFLLLIHLKMTGHLLYGNWKFNKEKKPESILTGNLIERENQYIRAIFYFDNGKEMAFSDLRKFGKFAFGKKNDIEKSEGILKLGPEPLSNNFTLNIFQSLLTKQKRKIKQVLMDQEFVAGIGNIYADEILWEAKINPFRLPQSLSKKEIDNLYQAIKKVLKRGVELRGTSVSDYRDLSGKTGRYGEVLEVYKREGEKCRRCGGTIKRVKIAGRSAHFCDKCQK